MKSSYPANFTHAHQEAKDGPSSERDRHQHLYRTLCRPAEVAPREGRDVRGRIGRKVGDFSENAFQLGIDNQSTAHRSTATTCGSSRCKNRKTLSRKIISQLLCRIFKVLETFFGKNAKLGISPVDIIPSSAYTTHTTIESHLCCLLQNHCTCAGYALVNLCNPGRFVHVA